LSARTALRKYGIRRKRNFCLRTCRASLAVTFPRGIADLASSYLTGKFHRARLVRSRRKKFRHIAFFSSGHAVPNHEVALFNHVTASCRSHRGVFCGFGDRPPPAATTTIRSNVTTFALSAQPRPKFAWVDTCRPRYRAEDAISSPDAFRTSSSRRPQSLSAKSKNSPGAPQNTKASSCIWSEGSWRGHGKICCSRRDRGKPNLSRRH